LEEERKMKNKRDLKVEARFEGEAGKEDQCLEFP